MNYKPVMTCAALLLLLPSSPVIAEALPSEFIDLWRDEEKKYLSVARTNAETWRDENMPHAKITLKEYCTKWTGCEGQWVKYELSAAGSSQALECQTTQEGQCVSLESNNTHLNDVRGRVSL